MWWGFQIGLGIALAELLVGVLAGAVIFACARRRA